jgi:hypothetical protein
MPTFAQSLRQTQILMGNPTATVTYLFIYSFLNRAQVNQPYEKRTRYYCSACPH